MIVQDHDALALERINLFEQRVGVKGEGRGGSVPDTGLVHLIHDGIAAVVGVVDDVAGGEVAEP